jgi:DNA-binding response OmpR family regulator
LAIYPQFTLLDYTENEYPIPKLQVKNMSKIMIVDDDPNIRELVCALLRSRGLDACEAKDGRDALQKMSVENPALVIIDLMMPNLDGFELCRHLRKYYENIPVFILTAKSELASKLKGFELGADDYLTKPFEGDELIVRVRALLRRYNIEASQSVQIGALTIDRASYSVMEDGKSQDIPMKEFELLCKLASAPGRTFSRNQLIEDVWGYDFEGNERTLDVHISRLRERFPAERCHFHITTLRGLGYRLEVDA